MANRTHAISSKIGMATLCAILSKGVVWAGNLFGMLHLSLIHLIQYWARGYHIDQGSTMSQMSSIRVPWLFARCRVLSSHWSCGASYDEWVQLMSSECLVASMEQYGLRWKTNISTNIEQDDDNDENDEQELFRFLFLQALLFIDVHTCLIIV